MSGVEVGADLDVGGLADDKGVGAGCGCEGAEGGGGGQGRGGFGAFAGHFRGVGSVMGCVVGRLVNRGLKFSGEDDVV